MINPDMVRLARELRDMTQAQLAKESNLAQGTISKIEVGDQSASEATTKKIAKATRLPTSFFYQEEAYHGVGISTLFYRKRASTLQKHIRRLQAEVNIRRICVKTLTREVEVSTPNDFLFMGSDESPANPEEIAHMVRASWKLPVGPIKNLTEAIETAGGIVFKFPFGTRDIDAISQWPDDSPPLFFVNSQSPPERIRFSMTHELGHMVMHRDATETMEGEANSFASEFLMPQRDIRHQLHDIDLAKAANMKPYWQVSMAALIYRAHRLGCISASRNSSLFAHMNSLGYRSREPNPLRAETPQFLVQLIEAHTEAGFTVEELAKSARLYEDDFRLRFMPNSGLRLAG